jgi:hypothetical protein
VSIVNTNMDTTEPIRAEELIRGFDLYQAQSIKTIAYPDEMKLWYPALGLGEAGEVQNKTASESWLCRRKRERHFVSG